MSRWFVALLYALMLACAALPASSQVLADLSGQQVELSIDAADAGQHPLTSPDYQPADGPLEAPELFDHAPAPHRAEPLLAGPLMVASGLAPPPFLEGPQRPPRAQALVA